MAETGRVDFESTTLGRRQAFAKAVFDMIPHWFVRDDDLNEEIEGLESEELECGGEDARLRFFATRSECIERFRPFLDQAKGLLKEEANDRRGVGEDITRDGITVRAVHVSTLEIEFLQKDLAIFWLKRWRENKGERVAWLKLFQYAEYLRHRTYENDPVSVNLIIDASKGREESSQESDFDITKEGKVQKFLDPLASSPQVCIRVDRNMNFIGYEEIATDGIMEPQDGKYYRSPHFIYPIIQRLDASTEFSFHRTRSGDILIADASGLAAAWRKGKWYLYDLELLRDTFSDLFYFDSIKTADYMIDLMLDLSYKRHGALIVYDPRKGVRKKIDTTSKIWSPNADAARKAFAKRLRSVCLDSDKNNQRCKRLIAEIASIDGAVVHDGRKIRAYGAMIQGSGKTGGEAGARTRATYAARDLGGHPIKISADGDVLIPLLWGPDDDKVPIVLRFA